MRRFANRNPKYDLPRTLEGGEERYEQDLEDWPRTQLRRLIVSNELSRADLTDEDWELLDSFMELDVLQNSTRDMFTEEQWDELDVDDQLLVEPYASAADELRYALQDALSDVNNYDWWEDRANDVMQNHALSGFAFEHEADALVNELDDVDARGDKDELAARAVELVNDWNNWSYALAGEGGEHTMDELIVSWRPQNPMRLREAVAAFDDDELLHAAFDDATSALRFDVVPLTAEDIRDERLRHDVESPFVFHFELDRAGIKRELDEEFPPRPWADYHRHPLRSLNTFRPSLPTDTRAFPWLSRLQGGWFEVVELGSFEDLVVESNWLEHCLSDPDNNWPQKFAGEEYSIFSIRPVDAANVWQPGAYGMADRYTGKELKRVVWTLPHFTVAGYHRGGGLLASMELEHVLGYHNREPGEGPSGASFRPWEVALVWDALASIDDRYDVDLERGWNSVVAFLRRQWNVRPLLYYGGLLGKLGSAVVMEYDVSASFATNTVKAFFELEATGELELDELEELRERGIINPDEGSCPTCGGPRKGFCLPPGAGRRRGA